MGILADGLAILLGGLLGEKLKKKTLARDYSILAICIMLVSLVGFLENVYNVKGEKIISENLITVLFAFLVGSIIGEKTRLEERLSGLNRSTNQAFHGFLDAVLFFGIGGLQISGPILWVSNQDNSQLFIKSCIDFPFAVAYGAAYGKSVSLAALPVALMQLGVALIAYAFSSFFSREVIAQLCAIGYMILFFSGFNLMPGSKNKINNINMLPGILMVVLFHFVVNGLERII